MPVEVTTPHPTRRYFPARLSSRGFVGVIIAIGGMQLMTAMDGPVAVLALSRIQDELSLSDVGRSWVITGYLLTYGGLLLFGGRLGDTFGRKRAFIIGVSLFTLASALCGIAWDEASLVSARLLHGVGAGITAPTCMALVATTFPRGPTRNTATAVLGATAGIGAVMGLVVGGALTDVSWRLAFLVNVPIGLLVLLLAGTTLRETQKERMRLDAAGAVLATLTCTAVVFGLLMGPVTGWLSAATIGPGAVALAALVAFVFVERTAENPIVPLSLFTDRSRVATFAAVFLWGGLVLTLVVLVALYVQTMMGYSPLSTGIAFIPFAIAMAIGTGAASKLVVWFPPRVVVIAGATLVLGALLYGSTLNRAIPYFPNLVVPLIIGSIGIGLIGVPLTLSVIASVGFDRIGPASAMTVMLQTLGGPIMLAGVQAVITSRTLHLGGITGPVSFMDVDQLDAFDRGFTYGLLWLAGVAALLGAVALLINYTAQQVARVQKVRDAGKL